jgi:hypothetical protein
MSRIELEDACWELQRVVDEAVAYIEATEYASQCPTRGLVKKRFKDLSDVRDYVRD